MTDQILKILDKIKPSFIQGCKLQQLGLGAQNDDLETGQDVLCAAWVELDGAARYPYTDYRASGQFTNI